MAGQFEGKVALVTGGNSGIGKATAIRFAEEGAKVVIAARRVPEGEQTVEEIRKAGGEAFFVHADVSRASDVEAMVKTSVQTFGRRDCAFNNAGISGSGPAPHCVPGTRGWPFQGTGPNQGASLQRQNLNRQMPHSPLRERRGEPKNQALYQFRGVRSEGLPQTASGYEVMLLPSIKEDDSKR